MDDINSQKKFYYSPTWDGKTLKHTKEGKEKRKKKKWKGGQKLFKVSFPIVCYPKKCNQITWNEEVSSEEDATRKVKHFFFVIFFKSIIQAYERHHTTPLHQLEELVVFGVCSSILCVCQWCPTKKGMKNDKESAKG